MNQDETKPGKNGGRMTGAFELTERTDRLGLPVDLSAWFAKERLAKWIAEDMAQLDWLNPTLVKYIEAHPEFRPRVLLRLLTFLLDNLIDITFGLVDHLFDL